MHGASTTLRRKVRAMREDSAARVADWSDYNYIVGNPVKREDGFVRLLTEYDQVLLQFGMHISWKR